MKKFALFALIVLSNLFFFTANSYANDEELYICPVKEVYKTGAGRSIDMPGGTVKFTINGENIVVTNPSVSGFGSIPLTIIQRNGIKLKQETTPSFLHIRSYLVNLCFIPALPL